MHVASEATVKWKERERERERERSACCKFACLPAGWSLWRQQGGLQDQDVKTVHAVKPLWGLRVRCLVMLASSLAVLRLVLVVRSSGNCPPTCVLGPAFWAAFPRSCRHCFVAVDVGHPLCGLPWLVVVVVLLAMFRFAFVVLSSRLRATQVSPVVVGAGLHAGQVPFPSAWCVLRHHRFVAVFV